MYGGKRIFKSRIAGFTMGTGSTLALLPPENATGNFIKVVQRDDRGADERRYLIGVVIDEIDPDRQPRPG